MTTSNVQSKTSTKQFYDGLFLFLGLIFIFLHGRKQGADENHYLAWTHSLFYDWDLFLLNQFEMLGLPYFITPTGMVGEIRNIGTAVFWLPFYAISSPNLFLWPAFASTGTAVDDPIQLLFVNWSTILFVTFSLGLMFVILKQYFSSNVSWLSVVAVFLGTSLFFYTVQRPISSHPVSVLLASTFLWMWIKNRRTTWGYGGAGILIGWLMFVATYNLVLLLIPLTELVYSFVSERKLKETLLRGSVLFGGIILGFFPQMLVWRVLYGSFVSSPYAGQLFWLNSQIFSTLFSPFHGLFVFAPVLLLAALGIVFFIRYDTILGVGIGLAWLGLTYIVGANVAWWAGASFGNRYFLVLSPFFALMLGALLQHSFRWLWLMVPAVLWTIGLLFQTLDGTLKIGEAQYYPLSTLLVNQLQAWRNIPLIIPWHNSGLISFSPTTVGGILFLSAIVYIVGYWVIIFLPTVQTQKRVVYGITVVSVLIIFSFFVVSQRSEKKKMILAEQGFYDRLQRVSMTDPWNAMRNYMERASYYENIGRSDLVLPNIQSAADAWFSSNRKIFGSTTSQLPPLTQRTKLHYGSDVRLLGYIWDDTNVESNELVLYWEKISTKQELTYSPLVKVLNAEGRVVAEGTLINPFPAFYIPEGYIFYDLIPLDWYDKDVSAPLWLEVTFPYDDVSPQVEETHHSGIINLGITIAGSQSLSSGLLSVPLKPTFDPGERVGIYIVWDRKNFSLPSKAQIAFLDQQEQFVFKVPVNLFFQGATNVPIAENPNQLSVDTLCFDTPPSLTPGEYQLKLLDSLNGEMLPTSIPLSPIIIQDNAQQKDTICNRITEHLLKRQYAKPEKQGQAQIIFPSLAALLEYDLTIISTENGLEGQVSLQWQSLANNPMAARPRLQLINDANQTISEISWTPKDGTHPPEYWLKNELITDTITFPIPDLAPDQYYLVFDWVTPHGDILETQDSQTGIVLEEFIE